MFGFLFGAACLFGLAATVHHHRCHEEGWAGGWGPGWRGRRFGRCGPFGRHGHPGHRGHHGWGQGFGGGFGPSSRRVMRGVFERLDTSPGQEKVILDAVEKVRGAGERFRGELGETRRELARALRGEHLDIGAVRGLFEKHDGLLNGLREELLGGLSRVHEALDERQRRELAEIIEDVGRFGRG